MVRYNRKKRFISICTLFIGITILTIFYLNRHRHPHTSLPDDTSLHPIVQKFVFNTSNSSDTSSPRILCLILTSPKTLLTRARAVHDTWAPRCTGYYFITEHDSNSLKGELLQFARRLPIAPIKNLTAGYDHLTQKSTLAFLFAYEKHFDEFDWFIKADDDTYLFVDHLQLFLSGKNTSEPVTYGYNFKTDLKKGYHSGGGSYVLSRESLQRFYQAHHDPKSGCPKDGGNEDVEVTTCLSKRGVYPGKSLDEYGRELFHPLSFENHFRGNFPPWLIKFADNPLRTHYNCCSEQTISFHYLTATEQYMTDFLVYKAGLTSQKKANKLV